MKSFKHYTAASLVALGMATTSTAQDIHFSQFDETPLQLNPANAGTSYDLRFIGNYKSQWQSVNAPFKTIAFSGDGQLLRKKKNHLGLGLTLFSDNSGSQLKTFQANLSLSAIINLNDHNSLSAGLMGGFAQRSSTGNAFTWSNQYNGQAYDATLPTGEPGQIANYSFLDLGAGLQYTYGSKEMYMSANNAKRVTLGVSVFHPHQPAYSYYANGTKLYAKLVFHGDAAIGIKNTNLVLKPSYIVFVQGPAKEITPGLLFQYLLNSASKYTTYKKFTAFSLGAYYRANDALIACAKFEYNNYALGFSYDVNLSKLRTVSSTRGGFELSLRAVFNKNRSGSFKPSL